MAKVYFPNSEQFDQMNVYLDKIARAVGGQLDVSTWAGVQRAVKIGIAPDLFPVGTQLLVNHTDYGERAYDVVAHNHFKSAFDENAPTMTLVPHDLLNTYQYDSAEAFYYAEAELPAGTYHFTLASAYSKWEAGTYQFTLTQALPKGGQLTISGYADAAMTTRKVRAYTNQTTTSITEEVAITVGEDGTNLGTFGTELNHSQRVSYGSNNYKESALRQLLNSSASAGSVWKPQTKFDRPPSWLTTANGFMKGFDADFLAVLGKVIVPCSANNTYEAPDSTTIKNTAYTVNDTFFPLSRAEIYGTNDVADGSVLLPYYKGASNIDRIKYKNGSPAGWWMRTAHASYASSVRIVYTGGSLDSNGAVNSFSLVPACNIV